MALKVHDSSSLRVAEHGGGAARGGGAALPTSMWALMALVCAILMVPPFPIIAIVLGLVARGAIARYGDRTGRGVANIAIGLGAVQCVLWTIIGFWLYTNIRLPIKEGPVQAIEAAIAGDVHAMAGQFETGPAAPAEEAEAFARAVQELSLQYGKFVAFHVDDSEERQADEIDFAAPTIPYVMEFTDASLRAEAQYLVRELTFTFNWIRIFDPVQGELTFPEEAARRAGQDRESDGESDGDSGEDEAAP